MAVYGNFKGTTQPGFTVGKTGAASIFGNPSSPPSSPTAGDVWMDSANTALKVYDGSEWSQGNFVGNLEGFIEIEVVAGENLVKGDVVYISGSSGNTPEVSKAQANSTSTMPAIGICEQTINSGNTGFIVVQGLLTGINTSSFTEGDVLYVSSTVAGAFTSTAPTGESNRIQNVGKVVNSAGGGSILVTGAGRFNATSALDNGNIFIGNGSNQAVTASLDTSVGDLGFLKNVVEDTTPQLGGELDAQGNNITSVDTLRINTDGAGLRMTSVGAFDNTGGSVAGNFRVFATNDLILNAGGQSGNAIVVDASTLDATFAGTIRVHDAYTLPSADGSANQYLQTDGSGTISFADGPIGYTGSQGDIGYTGSQGFTGSQGDQGVIGFTGSKGDTGFNGSIGFTGSQGDIGFTGSKGDTGFNGSVGFTGSKGDIGFTGSQGNVGFTGSKGDTAISGSYVHTQGSAATTWTITHNLGEQYVNVQFINASGNSLIGTYSYPTVSFDSTSQLTATFTTATAGYASVVAGSGFSGSVGFTGSQGDQGIIGFTGSKGDIGFTGSASSVQGPIGYTGSKGDQGVIGYTGSKGDQGDIGFTGSAGAQGLIGFTGSQGDQGVIGYTGSKGDQGITGFTGSQGDIGFTGSKGDIGFTGSQGDIGYTGSKGDIGFTGSKGDTGFDGSIGFTGSQGGFGGATFEYDWSTDTALSDPGTGTVKINNANLTAGTILSIDDEDANGTDIQQFLRTIDDSSSAIKGHFRMANKLNADDFVMYTISAISEETGYFEVTVSYVDGSATSFTNGEELIMTFARTGDKGDTGFTGSKGDIGFTGSTR